MTLSLQNPAIGKVTVLKDELCRLLILQKKNLQSFKDADVLAEKGTLTPTSADDHIAVLDNEIPKVQKLELLVAVVGAMKAGKSTTINAIVGSEVLPNRSGAMTSLPTVIRHTPERIEPHLKFEKNDPFNQLILDLRKVIQSANNNLINKINANDHLKKLAEKIKKDSKFKFAKQYNGTKDIYDFLFDLNDIVRLAKELGSSAPLDEYTQMKDFPCIEVAFNTLKDVQNSVGTFSLLDTPGPNEASAGDSLREVVKEQLSKASAVLAVLDYTQRNNDADAQMHQFLSSVDKEHLFVVLNKADQKGHKETNDDVNSVREGIAKTMGDISIDRVLGISSQRAMLANRALHASGKLPPLTEDWVRQFAEFAFGEYDDYELEDEKEVSKRANKILKKSLFPELIEKVIAACYKNAPTMVFNSALDKLKTIHSGEHGVANFLQVRNEAAQKSDDELRQAITRLEGNLKELHDAQNKLGEMLRSGKKKGNLQTEEAQEKIRKEIDEALRIFFLEGQVKNYEEQDSERKEAQEREKNTSIWNKDIRRLFKPIAEKVSDFDPSKIENPFDTAEEAAAYTMKIIQTINPIFTDADKKIMEVVDADLKNLATEMENQVQSIILPLTEKIQKEIANSGFSMQFSLSKEDMKKIAPPKLEEKKNFGYGKTTETKSYWGEKSGFVAGILRFFNSDWGHEWKEKKVDKITVNLNKMREEINSDLNSYFQKINSTLDTITTERIEEGIQTIEQSLSQKLRNWQGDFEAERCNKEAEITKQEETKKFFAQATEAHALLQKHVEFTRSEVDGLKASPM